MAKKQWWQVVSNWMWIAGIPAAITALFFIAKTMTVYAELPNEFAKTKEDVVDIKDMLKEQKMANDLMQQMIQQNKEPMLSPDKKYYWSEQLQEWRSTKELQHGR